MAKLINPSPSALDNTISSNQLARGVKEAQFLNKTKGIESFSIIQEEPNGSLFIAQPVDLTNVTSDDIVIDQDQEQSLPSVPDHIKYKWQTGMIPLARGGYGREAMFDRMDSKEALDLGNKARLEQMEKANRLGREVGIKEAPILAILGEATELVPFMMESVSTGLATGLMFSGAYITTALIAGNVGPQALVPEEAFTVPVAFSAAMANGMTFGIIKTSIDVEGGNLYLDLIEKEVSEKTARPLALGAGMAIGIIEASELFLFAAPIKKLFTKMIKTKTAKKALLAALRQYFKTLSVQVGQEELQEIVQIATEILAGHIENNPEAVPTTDQIKERLINVASKTGQGLAVLGAPGAGTTFVSNIDIAKEASNLKAKVQEEKGFIGVEDEGEENGDKEKGKKVPGDKQAGKKNRDKQKPSKKDVSKGKAPESDKLEGSDISKIEFETAMKSDKEILADTANITVKQVMNQLGKNIEEVAGALNSNRILQEWVERLTAAGVKNINVKFQTLTNEQALLVNAMLIKINQFVAKTKAKRAKNTPEQDAKLQAELDKQDAPILQIRKEREEADTAKQVNELFMDLGVKGTDLDINKATKEGEFAGINPLPEDEEFVDPRKLRETKEREAAKREFDEAVRDEILEFVKKENIDIHDEKNSFSNIAKVAEALGFEHDRVEQVFNHESGNIPVREVTDLKSSHTGKPLAAKADFINDRIIFDEVQVQKTFDEKAWTKPKVKGVKPFNPEAFGTVDEWRTFLIEHEKALFTKEVQNLKPGAERENRANKIAMEKLLIAIEDKESQAQKKAAEEQVVIQEERETTPQPTAEELEAESEANLKAEQENIARLEDTESAIREIAKGSKPLIRKTEDNGGNNNNFANTLARGFYNFKKKFIALQPMDVVFDLMDTAASFTGVNFKTFKETMNIANRKRAVHRENIEHPVLSFHEKAKLHEENYKKILVVATLKQDEAAGNKNGREKLLRSLTEEDLIKIETEGLNKNEQKMLDLMQAEFEKLINPITKTMKEVYGRDFSAIKVYFPMLTDFDAMDDFEIQNMFANDAAQFEDPSIISPSFLHQRKGGAIPIKTNALNVFLNYVDSATYLIHMAKPTNDLMAIAAHPGYKEAVGEFGQKAVLDWLALIIRKGGAGKTRISVLDTIRKNASVALLGYKLSTILIQPTALLDGAAIIGGYAFKGLHHITLDPDAAAWKKFIKDNFVELRIRTADDPAYAAFLDDILDESIFGKLKKHAFTGVRALDGITATAIAAGAYEKIVTEKGGKVDFANPDQEAIIEAELVVSRSQASGQSIDLPAAVSQGGLTGNVSIDKAITQFQVFLFGRASMFTQTIGKNGFRDTPELRNITTFVILALIAEVFIRRGAEEIVTKFDGDDDDLRNNSFLKRLVFEGISGVPIVGQSVNAIRYDSYPIPVISLAERAIVNAGHAIVTEDDKEKKLLVAKAILELTGLIGGTPGASQIEQIVRDVYRD